VLAEAVQEDDGGARLGGGPVAVVHPAPGVVEDWHAHDCSNTRGKPQPFRSSRGRRIETRCEIDVVASYRSNRSIA
jgi:hypothetical protein